MSFADVLKNNKSNLAKLKEQAESQGGGAPRDPRKWKHSYDKTTMVGTTLIRFLPRYDENGEVQLPWVSWTEFNFKNKANKYYANRNLADLGEADPVGELNKAHWGSIPEAERKNGAEAKKARQRNVRQKFIANIVVLEDNAKPENVGKVFLYEFGPSVKKLLEKALFPKFEHVTPLEFYNWDDGANFRIATYKDSQGWLNYDENSTFESPSPLANGDRAIWEQLYNSMYDLSEFTAKDNYKGYDELKKELLQVVGQSEYCRIMGEEFTPEQSAQNGQNPFPQAQAQNDQNTQTKAQESAQNGNPFPQAQESAPSKAEETGSDQANPFPQAQDSSKVDPNNPFAKLNVG